MLLDGQSSEALMAGTSRAQELEPAYAQFRDQSRFWIQRVAVPLLMVIGLFGNLITVIIMTRRRMRSTTNMYLAALAFVDMLYLVLTFLLGLSHYPNMAGEEYYAYWKLRPFLMMLTDACSNTSVWLTVSFTIERYIAVKYPMKGKVWCTEARAKMLILSVISFCTLFAAPVPFEWVVVEKVAPVTATQRAIMTQQSSSPTNHTLQNTTSSLPVTLTTLDAIIINNDNNNNNNSASDNSETGYNEDEGGGDDRKVNVSHILALEYSDFGRNETYKTIYYWSTAVIFYFIPLFSLMLFNGFLIKSVHHSKRERTKMTRASTTMSSAKQVLPSMTKHDNKVLTLESDQASPLPTSCGDDDDHHHDGLDSSTKKFSNGFNSNYNNNDNNKKEKLKLLVVSTYEETPRKMDCVAKETGGSALRENHRDSSCPAIKVNDINGDDSEQDGFLEPDAPTRAQPQTQEAGAHMGHRISFIHDKLTESQQAAAAAADTKTQAEAFISEPNVQNNCDYSCVAAEHADAKVIDFANRRTTVVSDEVSIQKSRGEHERNGGVKSSRETINYTNGKLPLVAPLRRSHITNASSRSQHSMAPVSSQERRITIMLIAVVILFLVCQIPSAAMILYTSVNELVPNTNEHALVLAFGNIFNFLMAVNAAGNFILYSFLSKKYRRTFIILFCSCLGSKMRPPEARRTFNSRYESSGASIRNHHASSMYQNNAKSDKIRRDTQPPIVASNMGQVVARLQEKYLAGEDCASKQESRGMLHDFTMDESEFNITGPMMDGGDGFDEKKTPQHVLKLKCDPRSPSNFDRTPLKVPLEE